ncbi:hypothetical protein GQ600_12063 [Phytophthora cactorum]|nr:hypothetical protein GQ600_12063 [Phytophthora cactorum]
MTAPAPLNIYRNEPGERVLKSDKRLRKDLTNDFADIEGSHMASGGNFWVATATQDESTKIVGIIGLQRRSESEAKFAVCLFTRIANAWELSGNSWRNLKAGEGEWDQKLVLDNESMKKQALEFYAASDTRRATNSCASGRILSFSNRLASLIYWPTSSKSNNRHAMTVETSTIIKVRQYRPEDHGQVTKIYVEGLMTCDSNPKYRYLWEELLRKDLTNDLADIEGSHMAPGGNFLVAVGTKDGSARSWGLSDYCANLKMLHRFDACMWIRTTSA